MEMLIPLIASKDKNYGENSNSIFDIDGLKNYLGVSKQWIYERTHLKEIPHLKIDGQLRFSKRDIDKWLSSYSVPALTGIQKKVLNALK